MSADDKLTSITVLDAAIRNVGSDPGRKCKPNVPPSEEVTSSTPLRLGIAAQIAFPLGGITEHTLRLEHKRGNLVVETYGNKHFTTLAHIEEMRKRKCRDIKRSPALARTSEIHRRRENLPTRRLDHPRRSA